MPSTAPTSRPTWTLDHFAVDAAPDDPALASLRALFGLEAGARPPFPFPGSWNYRDGRALLHVIERPERREPALNHIAFRSEAPAEEVLAQVRATGLPYQTSRVPKDNTLQVFVRFGEGLIIELDLRDPAASA